MRFTHLKLGNWRNFVSVDVALAQRVFIVGPNASGKSNLLDALRFLRDVARPAGGLLSAVEERGGLLRVRSLHAGIRRRSMVRGHEPPFPSMPVLLEVRMELDGKPWRYRLELDDQYDDVIVVSEEVDGPDGPLLRRPDADDSEDPERLTQTHLEQISTNGPFRKLALALASVQYVHVVPELIRQPRGVSGGHAGQRDTHGTDLLESIRALPNDERNRRLLLVQGQLAKVIPQLKELRYWEMENGTPHIGARFFDWKAGQTLHREDQLSDGTLRLLGLLWVLGSGTSPVLLEEPEMSLHAAAVRQIPQLLARVASHMDRQILVSTHSEEMLTDTGIDPSEVIILTPTEAGTVVSLGSEDPALVALAESDAPLSGLLVARTKPKDVEQLAYAFGDEAE
jgi:predicted ATPase